MLTQKGNASEKDKLKTHIVSHDLGDTLVQEMIARGDSLCVMIESVIMLNGGILPGMHRPTLMQKLMLIPGINWVVSSLAPSVSVFSYSISKVFGPNTKPTEEELKEYYALVMRNGGEAILTQNIKYMPERDAHHDRWVNALKRYATKSNGKFLLIDGPADPVSGRHLAQAVQEQVDGAKVVFLSDGIGHWPQVEAPEEVMKSIMAFHHEIHTFD